MKETLNDVSDNLYYADLIGTVKDQIKFLDSLNFTEPCIIYDCNKNHELFIGVAHNDIDGVIHSRLVTILPSMPLFRNEDSPTVKTLWPRKFGTSSTVDIKEYLASRGFSLESITSKFTKSCAEDHSVAVADTAVEDAAYQSPTEELECGN